MEGLGQFLLLYTVFIFLVLLLIALVPILLAGALITAAAKAYRKRWGPFSCAGVVVRKWRQEAAGLPQGHGFRASFRISGEEREFEVPERVYAKLEEGREGTLTYLGDRLIRFAPSEPCVPWPR